MSNFTHELTRCVLVKQWGYAVPTQLVWSRTSAWPRSAVTASTPISSATKEIDTIREREHFKKKINAFLCALRQCPPPAWRGAAAQSGKKHMHIEKSSIYQCPSFNLSHTMWLTANQHRKTSFTIWKHTFLFRLIQKIGAFIKNFVGAAFPVQNWVIIYSLLHPFLKFTLPNIWIYDSQMV